MYCSGRGTGQLLSVMHQMIGKASSSFCFCLFKLQEGWWSMGEAKPFPRATKQLSLFARNLLWALWWLIITICTCVERLSLLHSTGHFQFCDSKMKDRSKSKVSFHPFSIIQGGTMNSGSVHITQGTTTTSGEWSTKQRHLAKGPLHCAVSSFCTSLHCWSWPAQSSQSSSCFVLGTSSCS